MLVLTAPAVLLDDELVPDAWVAIATDQDPATEPRIIDVGVGPPPPGRTLRLSTGVLAPGLIDLQVNGAFGHDLATTDDIGWREVLTQLPRIGVTSVLPTVVTAPWPELTSTVTRLAAWCDQDRQPTAARCLGLHVEGPFLSPVHPGAHRPDLLRPPTDTDVEALLTAGGPQLRLVTLAPELPGGAAAVARLTAAGVRVAIGHSDATVAEVTAAVDAGASFITHLYNAQRALHHREPGVVGAGLSDSRLTLGLIADLVHVAPAAIRVAFASAEDRVALVSDAVLTLGLEAGHYPFAGGTVVVTSDDAPPRREDGTLAGSALRLDHAVRNVVHCGVDPARVLLAATRIPADALGRRDLGRLLPGAQADLVWFDADWRLRATWLGGQLVTGDPGTDHHPDTDHHLRTDDDHRSDT